MGDTALFAADMDKFSENSATHPSRQVVSGHKSEFSSKAKLVTLIKRPNKMHLSQPQHLLWAEIAIFSGEPTHLSRGGASRQNQN